MTLGSVFVSRCCRVPRMTTRPSLPARKRALARQAMADDALALFDAHGFDGTTVDELAEAMNISRRTFFRYFPTKEAVVFEALAERLEWFRSLVATPEDGEAPYETVRRAYLAMARTYIEAHAEIARIQRIIDASPTLVARERHLDQAWDDAVADVLAPSLAGDGGRPRAERQAAAINGVVRATLRQWWADGAGDDLVARGQEALAELERGIGGAP